MKKWTADFGNDPNDDYNLVVEILCDDEEIAIVQKRNNEMEIKWYPNKDEIIIPLDWFLDLLQEAQKRLMKE